MANIHSLPTCGILNGGVPVVRRSDSWGEEKPCSKPQRATFATHPWAVASSPEQRGRDVDLLCE
ncbi:hypothetical protein E2C01_084020 [Portunus trituberculatus]|uniref:Uncharacterized protein n=1 Tax=Portunus trituberculatus TaxID=210409 RepID=A0A5B7IWX3_PORTR|nr:hypothetical protein [Portunus trituberculatus]